MYQGTTVIMVCFELQYSIRILDVSFNPFWLRCQLFNSKIYNFAVNKQTN